jgi:hypothetical protein
MVAGARLVHPSRVVRWVWYHEGKVKYANVFYYHSGDGSQLSVSM